MIPLEQAIYRRPDNQQPERIASSPGFEEDWFSQCEELVLGFGDRPDGVRCPAAVFAHPLVSPHVAIVQVADREMEHGGDPVTWFRILIAPQKAYENWIGNPFVVNRRLPPEWDNRDLQSESWPERDLEQRNLGDIVRILKRLKANSLPEDADPEKLDEIERTEENSESPALLGGVQILVDGGRVVFRRPNADSGMIPSLWTLLPYTTRNQLWPASFAFSNELGFDALVVPRLERDDFPGYSTEEHAEHYPQGRYEMNLQYAAESGDQAELNRLLNRRSYADTWRLGVGILIFLAVSLFVMNVFLPNQSSPPPSAMSEHQRQISAAAGIVGVQDPLTASSMIRYGKHVWQKRD